MHALALLCINQHTKYEVPSFTDSKDKIGEGIFITSHVTWPLPLGVTFSFQGKHFIYSTCTQNLATLTLTIPGIWLRHKNWKWVVWPWPRAF